MKNKTFRVIEIVEVSVYICSIFITFKKIKPLSCLYNPRLEITVDKNVESPELVAVVLGLHVLVELLAEVLLPAQDSLHADVLYKFCCEFSYDFFVIQ